MTAPSTAAAAGDTTSGRPARPVRFEDPARNAAYWARIERIVDAAPPLEDWQRAAIRTAFSQPAAREAA
ncbi:hypothetical protein [Streptomyces sp. NPDC000851]